MEHDAGADVAVRLPQSLIGSECANLQANGRPGAYGDRKASDWGAVDEIGFVATVTAKKVEFEVQ